jgi:CHAD domain-containing protein
VARIVDEQLSRAVDQLEGRRERDHDLAVHDARKCLKKSRSALRLARDDMGNEIRRDENVRLRDAGRRLSGVRDAQVLVETLESLEDELPATAYRPLRRSLAAHRKQLVKQSRDGGGQAQVVAQELTSIREHVGGWPLDDESFDSVRAGLRRMYRRGRSAMEEALEQGTDEAWHEWRKRVKDLWYSLRILQPIAPAQLSGMVDEADELSDVLGEHNDLSVLAEAVAARADLLEPADLEKVWSALERRQDRLRLAAVPLGKRLYAERPRAFARRLSAYWDARAGDRAAKAHWIDPAEAKEIRSLLAAKASAKGAERRRLGDRLRARGFRVSDFGHPGGDGGPFGPDDFDKLVKRGVIRLGAPPDAGEIA